MQMGYRATRRLKPQADETIVRSHDEAIRLIASLDEKLSQKLNAQYRATYLCARAVLYEAIGDPEMLPAAKQAFAYSKTAQSAALVAVALHHFGRIKEAIEYYKMSYRYPHEAGWEVDIGYSGALLFEGKWLEAWKIVKQLKKRMVYATYLKDWDGKPCAELSVLSEGGFGDLIQNSRFLPEIMRRVEHVTVYLPPYFYDRGFVELARGQGWYPDIKPLTEMPQNVVAAGFFDLPAILDVTPANLIPSPIWKSVRKADGLRRDSRPLVGFNWEARAMETPLIPDGVYRTLTQEQAQRIVTETQDKINWVSLQFGAKNIVTGLQEPFIEGWPATAAVMSELDAVVTVDSGPMHLAAAMGLTTHTLLSGAVDAKFEMGEGCRWYDNMKCYRNDGWGFENAVEKVIRELNA